jgi:hypothetical protein
MTGPLLQLSIIDGALLLVQPAADWWPFGGL